MKKMMMAAMLLCMVAMTCVVTSCGDDKNGEPNAPDTPVTADFTYVFPVWGKSLDVVNVQLQFTDAKNNVTTVDVKADGLKTRQQLGGFANVDHFMNIIDVVHATNNSYSEDEIKYFVYEIKDMKLPATITVKPVYSFKAASASGEYDILYSNGLAGCTANNKLTIFGLGMNTTNETRFYGGLHSDKASVEQFISSLKAATYTFEIETATVGKVTKK